MNDKELVAGAVGGDAGCRREIFGQCADMVYGIALRYAGGDRARAEDLTQKVFMNVFENLQSFGPPHQLRAWVARIAHNAGVDHWRSLARERAAFDKVCFMDGPSGASPEEELIKKERINLVKQGLAREPDSELKRAAVLFYEDGLSVAEIAERTGVSQTNVTTRLSRFRARMRKRLLRMNVELEQ